MTIRNVPPTAGLITWCRQLLDRVEAPMAFLRQHKPLQQLENFARVSQRYNRLCEALVHTELMAVDNWRAQLADVAASLNATVLVEEPESGELCVNSDERLFAQLEEARWLRRLGVRPLPPDADELLANELHYKQARSRLQECVSDLRHVRASLPPHLSELFRCHLEATKKAFKPGALSITSHAQQQHYSHVHVLRFS